MPIIKLRDFCNFQKGFAFKSSEYTACGTRIVRVSDLNDHNIELENCKFILSGRKYTQYLLQKDDVIITTVGSWESNPMSVVGKVVRVQESATGSLLNQNAVRVRTNNPNDQIFLFYLLKNDLFKRYIISTARGSASQASITQDSIKNYEFYLPDEHTREKISSILNYIDKKIDLGITYQQILEKLIYTIFAKLIEYVKPNFKTSYVYDHIVEMKQKNKEDNNYPVLSVVKEGEFKASEDVFTKQVYSKSTKNYKIVRRNQVAYNPARANIGSIAMLKEFDIGLVSPVYTVFEVKEDITPTYFYYYMKQPMFLEMIKHHAIGTTRQNFPFEAFKMFPIVVPPMDLQLKFEEIAKPIEQKIAKLKEENEVLAEIRDTLLPKLMSGELPVEVGEENA